MKRYKLNGNARQFQDTFPNMYPEYASNVNVSEDIDDSGIITKNVTFVVTESCNLRCTYCYECNKNYEKHMSKEVATKAIDMLLSGEKLNGYINTDKHKCIILEFIGGEPFLQVELIDYIVDYFRYKATELNHPWANNYMLNITSNGMLYNDIRVQNFIKKNLGRLSVSITIDGDKELHDSCRLQLDGTGSYDIVVEAINKAKEQIGLENTKVTFAPGNIKYISKSIPHLFDLGLTNVSANCVFEDVWKKEDSIILYNELIKLADYMLDNKIYQYASCSIFDSTIGHPMDESDNKNWCGGNGQMLAIGTDGRLFPCIRFMRYSLSNPNIPEIEIGDLDRGIDSEDNNELLKCLNCLNRRDQSTDECFNCPVAQGCAWCTGYNYDKFGTPNKRATFICWMHKARVLASYYYYNKLYQIENDDDFFELHLPQDDIDYITQGKDIKRWEK